MPSLSVSWAFKFGNEIAKALENSGSPSLRIRTVFCASLR